MRPEIKESSLCDYVYEPEPSVVKAELLNELSQNLAKENKDVFFYKGDERRTLLTSPKLVGSDFFKDSYRVIGQYRNGYVKIKRDY